MTKLLNSIHKWIERTFGEFFSQNNSERCPICGGRLGPVDDNEWGSPAEYEAFNFKF